MLYIGVKHLSKIIESDYDILTVNLSLLHLTYQIASLLFHLTIHYGHKWLKFGPAIFINILLKLYKVGCFSSLGWHYQCFDLELGPYCSIVSCILAMQVTFLIVRYKPKLYYMIPNNIFVPKRAISTLKLIVWTLNEFFIYTFYISSWFICEFIETLQEVEIK